MIWPTSTWLSHGSATDVAMPIRSGTCCEIATVITPSNDDHRKGLGFQGFQGFQGQLLGIPAVLVPSGKLGPAQFDLFSSISVCSFATLPGFCDIRILTWLAFLLVFAWLCSRFHEFTVVEAFIFCPHTLKKLKFLYFFTCKSLPTCQVLSISPPWPHCISTQNCICNLESFDWPHCISTPHPTPHHQQRNNMWRSNDPRDLYSVATCNARSARNVNVPPPTPPHTIRSVREHTAT